MRHLSLTVALVATLAATFLTAQATADPAVVFNYGHGNSTCSGSGFGGYYVGGASTVVYKDGLKMLQCHASLISGTPVSSTQVIHTNGPGGVCTSVFNPAGKLNYECAL